MAEREEFEKCFRVYRPGDPVAKLTGGPYILAGSYRASGDLGDLEFGIRWVDVQDGRKVVQLDVFNDQWGGFFKQPDLHRELGALSGKNPSLGDVTAALRKAGFREVIHERQQEIKPRTRNDATMSCKLQPKAHRNQDRERGDD